ARQRPDPWQHADEGAQRHADEAVEKVLGRQRDPEAGYQKVHAKTPAKARTGSPSPMMKTSQAAVAVATPSARPIFQSLSGCAQMLTMIEPIVAGTSPVVR